MNYLQQPQQIEQQSFEMISAIIACERPDYRFVDPAQEAVITRVIHTTADFDWLDVLWFSTDVLTRISAGLRAGCILYTDTTMALSGINKTRLAQLGCECRCFISDPRVAARAKAENITRSMAAVDIALQEDGDKLFVFGNAPTALFRLLEQQATPLAVIGVPVGFVGAAESKDALIHSAIPCIAATGRKGGSNVAAAIMNAILYRMGETE
ncbi:precorrin-8X methylmutase /cobalt-precorrin 8 methylmutase|uniref:Precorrin-8X methylmutase /cobalt-precorrin 8 methylmutase n=1 Tax=Brenneria salicis ATCC 15712 = DSM 30166 TaxID=714314 RepID=A0A366I3U9_9GAMM|nr:cobalt-precorrin-8 methylmutase [Brenneria salicis]NMN92118.1 precorrin-8X methylmutase /cobalt-precorrin 8 methylmutase [Brenneria salicis ATCC 15712 = DSM 30166]RBP61108.1 precorrin-8X methylmutase /cobalt-precorrin 8 methylmutase [Brenneria salicis ATCC 15712 = DSM 30166]RLM29805.1 precorrin-8X methylmutase [Brenneria salicis ATCC 15712 = DSM 30166]